MKRNTTAFNADRDFPFEDLRQTKDIIRLIMQEIHELIKEKRPIENFHMAFKDLSYEAAKIGDKALLKAVTNLKYLIDRYWPISEKTPISTLAQIKDLFRIIDEQTSY